MGQSALEVVVGRQNTARRRAGRVCQILAPPQGVGAVAVVWICGAIYLIAIRA